MTAKAARRIVRQYLRASILSAAMEQGQLEPQVAVVAQRDTLDAKLDDALATLAAREAR